VELRRRAVGRSRADEVQAGRCEAIPAALGRDEDTVVHTRIEVGEVVGLSRCGRLDLKGDRPTAVAIGDKKRLFRQSLPTPFIVGARDGGTLRQPHFSSDSEARDGYKYLLVIEESRRRRHCDAWIVGLKNRNRLSH
jgi:hypothetical protein